MIIFGLRNGNARQGELSSYDCGYCHSLRSVRFHFFIRYFHIFWIPLIPLYKAGRSQCNHCKQQLDQSQMPAAMIQDYGAARKKAKTPLKYFSWLIIAALFFIAALLAVYSDNNNTDTWLQQPQAGDVYEIKKDDAYTLYRIREVKGDTVVMNPYAYNTDKWSALRKLKRTYPQAYLEETIPLAKSELTLMYAGRVIRKIERK